MKADRQKKICLKDITGSCGGTTMIEWSLENDQVLWE